MTTIETRFGVGDVVFVADVDRSWLSETCPDCLGQRVWACTLPTGEELNIPCPTCSCGFEGSRGFLTDTWQIIGRVWQGTIGSINMDRWREGGPEFSYMLTEAGVALGRNYCDSDLFTDEGEAIAAATVRAEAERISAQEHNNTARARKKADRPGGLVAYLRREITRCEKDIAGKREHIARISAKHAATPGGERTT